MRGSAAIVAVAALVCIPGSLRAQDGAGLTVRLAHESEAEALMARELASLLERYDVEPWVLTRAIEIDERSIPHSHPVLTLHTRHIGDELMLLSTFVHEQLHWLEDARAEPWAAGMREFRELFPEVPSSSEGGARDEESTYRHLLVCDLEYQAMTALVGRDRARETLARITHYEWIYDRVLNDPRVRQVSLRNGFDLSEGVRIVAAPSRPTGQGAAIFERLAGEWDGEGTLMGRTARFTMRWEQEDGFAVLTFSNAFVGTDGGRTPVLNAAAVYRTSSDRPEAVWLDSRGARVEIRWEASDSALVSDWTAPTERGRTTYRVRSADELEVVDEVLSEGDWRIFGRARYSRASSRPGAGLWKGKFD